MGQGSTWTSAQREARLALLVERNRAGHVGPRLYEDGAWMHEAYVVRGLTLRRMAQESECGMRTIARWMVTHGIPTDRSRIGASTPKGANHPKWKGGTPCEVCGLPRAYGAKRCRSCVDISGEKNPKWRGAEATYEVAHDRVKALRGSAKSYSCVRCCSPAQEWAYDHDAPDEHPNGEGYGKKHGPYSLDPGHYMPMCRPCHKTFDGNYGKPAHGRIAVYAKGCRCDECRAANAAVQRRFRDRKKARLEAATH
jgi:hypothetical protein